MTEFLTIGEPIALFGSKEIDRSLTDATQFQKFLAGAEVNVAVGVSRLGHTSTYISQVGKDPFGEFIIKELKKNQIDTSLVEETSDYWTAFQLKDRVSSGDPSIFYFRKGSAAAHFNQAILEKIDFSTLKFAHLSGIFPAISQQACQAFTHLIELLAHHNIPTTFDPNLRPQLWESTDKMRDTLNYLASFATIVLSGINEAAILVGSRDPDTITDFYLNNGTATKTVIVKLGEDGAFVKTKDGERFTVPGFYVKEVIDTVGAGDGFAVGLLTGLMENLSLKEAVIRANAVGALAVQSAGDSDGYPTQEELARFLTAQEVQI